MATTNDLSDDAGKRQKYPDILARAAAMAFALILHLALLLWITLPASPLQASFRPVMPAAAMEVQLLRSLPATGNTIAIEWRRRPARSSISSGSREKAVKSSSALAMQRTASAPLPMAQPAIHVALSAAAPGVAPAEAIPYGNSRFSDSLGASQATGIPQLPGDDQPARVQGIYVDAEQSLSQMVQHIGHTLRCKDALFKSRMAADRGDAQLLQRGMTYQQAMQQWTELNCP